MRNNILVTGGYGLVGRNLQEEITLNPIDNHTVIFLSRNDCDFSKNKVVIQIFEKYKPKIVIHLAAKVGGLYANMSSNYEFYMENEQINLNIILACEKYKVKRLINILSTCVFPDSVKYPLKSSDILLGPPHPSNEGYAYAKRSLYIASKLLSEKIGNKTTIINLIPTNLYGKYDNFTIGTAHVIPELIAKAVQNGRVIIKGNGNALRQFVYARDLARIIIEFAQMKSYSSNFNTCIVSPNSNEEISIKDIAQIISNKLGFIESIEYLTEFSDGQLKKTTNDYDLKTFLPNFKFTSLNDGLEETILYYKNI